MATKKRGLGRGLDALLGGANVSVMQEQAVQADARELQHLPLDLIQRGKYQPRRDIDPVTLEELAESIKAQGVMQPIVVRPIGGGRYEIIAGERRWRAAKRAGLQNVPVVVRDASSDEALLEQALVENLHRADLNAMEEAAAYQQLIEDFGLTQEQAAARAAAEAAEAEAAALDQPLPVRAADAELRGGRGRAQPLVGGEDRLDLVARPMVHFGRQGGRVAAQQSQPRQFAVVAAPEQAVRRLGPQYSGQSGQSRRRALVRHRSPPSSVPAPEGTGGPLRAGPGRRRVLRCAGRPRSWRGSAPPGWRR